jgi:hypothetical protein
MSLLLDHFRRMSAIRAALELAADRAAGIPGAVVQIRLWNCRTFDHVKILSRYRKIIVIDDAPPRRDIATSDGAEYFAGPVVRTLAGMLERLRRRVALVYLECGGLADDSAAGLAAELTPIVGAMLHPGGVAVAEQPLRGGGLAAVPGGGGLVTALPGGPAALGREAAPAPSRARRERSSLDRLIDRVRAQRDCLEYAAGLIPGVPGPAFELGLANFRTYDHICKILPCREVFAFDLELLPSKPVLPDARHLVLGDVRDTVPLLVACEGLRAALIHVDLGNGEASYERRIAGELAPILAAALRPGGLVVSQFALAHPRLIPLPPPAGVRPGKYHVYGGPPRPGGVGEPPWIAAGIGHPSHKISHESNFSDSP